MFDEGELKLRNPEESFNMGWEQGDLEKKSGKLVTNRYASSRDEALEMLKKTVPPSFSNQIGQLVEKRKDKTNEKFDELIANLRKY